MNFKYQKKTSVIEAFQLTYEVAKSQNPIPQFAVDAEKIGKLKVYYTDKLHGSQYAVIETIQGKQEVNANDWILFKGGNLSTVSNDIFNNIYEQAE